MGKDVTIKLDDEVYKRWKKDKNRKGLIGRLTAEHYGFVVNKSRVVVNTSSAKNSETIPHLAAPLIQQFKPRESS